MGTLTLLTYITWSFNPDIFTIPIINFPLRWYGLLFALGFIIGQQIMNFIYKKEGRSTDEVDTLTLYIIAATILGARLGHVLFYDPEYYLENPSRIIATWEGGLASHGGALGVIIALYIFSRKTKVAYLWILDRVVIISILTGSLIRFGNLTNSEMIGRPTDLPWAFVFTKVDNIPRHPAQLYEAIYSFILFVLSFWVWYKFRTRMRNGFIFGWFLVILFTLRFIVEFFKINQSSFEDSLVLNMGQILSIPFILAGIGILLKIRFRKEPLIYTDNLSND
jgi:phosphatidylglycerol:prolipoprotein diacylglycerol transferase